MSEPVDPAVAELLSADLDGAVTPDEREAAALWVQRSAAARAERESLAAVKAALAGLPPVEPPAGFFESMIERGTPRADEPDNVVPLRRRRPVPVAAAVTAAAAAAWVAIAGTSAAATRPPIEQVEAALHVSDETFALSSEDAGVEWDRLPNGERSHEDGADVWVDLTSEPGVARVVVHRDGRTHTLVSEDLDAEELIVVGLELPGGPGDGIEGHVRRACQRLLGAFTGD
jgi:hypothetical protein